jgi:hypothetical protein
MCRVCTMVYASTASDSQGEEWLALLRFKAGAEVALALPVRHTTAMHIDVLCCIRFLYHM